MAAARIASGMEVLDVACGPGIVACAAASHAGHVTGIDLTPAMVAQAKARQDRLGLSNVTWRIGDATQLPFADGSFDVALTRYSFHHMKEPIAALREMKRVSRSRVVVIDATPTADTQAAYDRMETLRDPSHTRALPLSELKRLFSAAGLGEPSVQFSELRDEAKNLLARSSPNPGDEEKIYAMFRQSASDDSLGIPVRLDGEAIHYAYPVAIVAATRP